MQKVKRSERWKAYILSENPSQENLQPAVIIVVYLIFQTSCSTFHNTGSICLDNKASQFCIIVTKHLSGDIHFEGHL